MTTNTSNTDYEFNNSEIDISEIDRDKLLGLLWANATHNYNHNNTKYDECNSKKVIHKDGYVDYILGRPIKCQVYNSKFINSFYYNRDNGENKMEEIIEYIKSKKYNSKLLTVESENLEIQKIIDLENIDKNIDKNVLKEANELYNDLF